MHAVVNKTGQELVVSAVPTLSGEMFHWDTRTAGYFMAAMGALVLPANILVNSVVGKDAEDRSLVSYMNVLSLLSVIFLIDTNLIDYSVLQYVLGSSLLFAFLNAMEGVIMSLLSKIVSPELAKGTFNSGTAPVPVPT